MSPACGARKSPCSPASASLTTRDSSAATWPASQTACSKRSHARLRLDDAERAHLFDLARALNPTRTTRRRRAANQPVRPSVQHLLDALTGAPAFVHNARLDNLAANELGQALYCDMLTRAVGPGPVNSAHYVFLDPGARDFYIDWDRAASDVVAILRSAAGRDPYDRDLSNLVGELSTQSDEFRTRWAAHNVRFHNTGTKDFHHPVVGDITLTYNRVELPADPGLMIMTYVAEPGSKSAEALSLLGSWAATYQADITPQPT